jgi:hypothetical protein
MNKKLKSIPKLRSEAEERRFWQTLTPATISTGPRLRGCAFQISNRQRLRSRYACQ